MRGETRIVAARVSGLMRACGLDDHPQKGDRHGWRAGLEPLRPECQRGVGEHTSDAEADMPMPAGCKPMQEIEAAVD